MFIIIVIMGRRLPLPGSRTIVSLLFFLFLLLLQLHNLPLSFTRYLTRIPLLISLLSALSLPFSPTQSAAPSPWFTRLGSFRCAGLILIIIQDGHGVGERLVVVVVVGIHGNN